VRGRTQWVAGKAESVTLAHELINLRINSKSALHSLST